MINEKEQKEICDVLSKVWKQVKARCEEDDLDEEQTSSALYSIQDFIGSLDTSEEEPVPSDSDEDEDELDEESEDEQEEFQQWEYDTFDCKPCSLEQQKSFLNSLGQAGWELILLQKCENCTRFYMKRPI